MFVLPISFGLLIIGSFITANPADVSYSVCVSPAGEKEDCCNSVLVIPQCEL